MGQTTRGTEASRPAWARPPRGADLLLAFSAGFGCGTPPVSTRAETRYRTGNWQRAPGLPIFNTAATLALWCGGPFGVALASLATKGGSLDVTLSALETKGLIRRLAEPDLVALSGDTASFLAGGEFPVPSVQPGSTGGVPVITTEYKPFGVQLTFVPTVLAGGIINLRLAPSVSELDFTQAVQISGFNVPSITKREARTTIELRDGQSFAIAGLLQARNQRDISQLPWIGSVPVIGALFRSAAYQQEETDLVVIVTPHLVAPAVPGQRLASPLDNYIPTNDVDFFLMGEMEQKKKFRDYITSGGDIQGPYGHIIRSAPALPGPNLGQELRHMTMKIRCIIGSAAFAATLACSGAWAWDQDPAAQYFQRKDTIVSGAGDARDVNAATHIIDPWPRYVGNRQIPANGDRMARAVERYREGSCDPPAMAALAGDRVYRNPARGPPCTPRVVARYAPAPATAALLGA